MARVGRRGGGSIAHSTTSLRGLEVQKSPLLPLRCADSWLRFSFGSSSGDLPSAIAITLFFPRKNRSSLCCILRSLRALALRLSNLKTYTLSYVSSASRTFWTSPSFFGRPPGLTCRAAHPDAQPSEMQRSGNNAFICKRLQMSHVWPTSDVNQQAFNSKKPGKAAEAPPSLPSFTQTIWPLTHMYMSWHRPCSGSRFRVTRDAYLLRLYAHPRIRPDRLNYNHDTLHTNALDISSSNPGSFHPMKKALDTRKRLAFQRGDLIHA